MELHRTVRALVADHGTAILEDPSGFRGLLDDVLDERDASTGDINLLVDAVRFDALGSLVAMVDGGADPVRAVEAAGARLARDRGGDDRVAAGWAAAVLGYAVDRVPEAVAERYRALRDGSPAPGETAPPPVPPTGNRPDSACGVGSMPHS
ncbi:hypothetical protein [Nocardioides sp. YIM 152588]|uniref:hypothetical protein n=1 Tax=Nocardioides sp. YIM 152588 TaxID=3158259 RepID=UPI0032E4A35A